MAPKTRTTTANTSIKKRKAKTPTKYIIDASKPTSDKIFDAPAFERFLVKKIKVDGRLNNFGDNVKVEAKPDGKIEVVVYIDFSGRQLKYLTKKFLKKNELRDWLRVISTAKRTYTVKFYNVTHEGDEEDEE